MRPQGVWVLIPGPIAATWCCVSLHTSPPHFVPQFPHLENGGDNHTSLLGEFRRLDESVAVKHASHHSQRGDSLSINYWNVPFHTVWAGWPSQELQSQSFTHQVLPLSPLGWMTSLAPEPAWDYILLVNLLTCWLPGMQPLGHQYHAGREFCSSCLLLYSPRQVAPRGAWQSVCQVLTG